MKIILSLLVVFFTISGALSSASQFKASSMNIEECLAIDPTNYFGMTLVFVFDSRAMAKEDVLRALNKFEEYEIPFRYRYLNSDDGKFKFESQANPGLPLRTAEEKANFKNSIRTYVYTILYLRGLVGFRCEYRQSPAITGNN